MYIDLCYKMDFSHFQKVWLVDISSKFISFSRISASQSKTFQNVLDLSQRFANSIWQLLQGSPSLREHPFNFNSQKTIAPPPP